MSDGRPDRKNPKKRSSDGPPPGRRRDEAGSGRPAGPRAGRAEPPSGPRRGRQDPSEARRSTGDDRPGGPGAGRDRPVRRGGRDDTPGGPAGGRRDKLSAGRRDDDRGPVAEEGFGPFRGRPRPATGPEFGRRGEERGTGGAGGRRDRQEARTVRTAAEEAVARASGGQKPALRIVHSADGERAAPKAKGAGGRAAKGKTAKRAAAGSPPAPQRPKPIRDGGRLQEALARGARALERGYEQEALRMLRPYREPHPDSADLRELLGVAYYRAGRWNMAQKELDTFVALTGSTEQHPVLMDCARALGRFNRVETLWEELRAVSPAAEIVTEGRIVFAGALADQGKLDKAIKVLEKAPAAPRRVLPHHLRLWYALADLHERAGDIPAARAMFRRVSAEDPQFVDVAERLAALS